MYVRLSVQDRVAWGSGISSGIDVEVGVTLTSGVEVVWKVMEGGR
jgi:hypothetical protein